MVLEEFNAILLGGLSTALPDHERVRYVADGDTKVKVAMGNRYEHFESTRETFRHGHQDLRVFAWTGRTYVAE